MVVTAPYHQIDQPAAIRPGEELPVEDLQDYLRQWSGRPDARLHVQQFQRGFSNLTYCLRFGENEWVLRRPPFGANIKSGHDMHREYSVLRQLKPVFDAVPQAILYCDDASVIGAPFYLMERMRGVILRGAMPATALPDQLTLRRLSQNSVELLAAIHAIDIAATGLSALGKPAGYVERQVLGWCERFRRAQPPQAKPAEKLETVMSWLAANMPEPAVPALVHNDYKYDNLVLDPNDLARIVAVLDWEMATIGDPLLDLGTSLGYWIEASDPDELKLFGMSWRAGNFTREEVVACYTSAAGIRLLDPLFYFVFGVFKIAVIAQQIYCRYALGHTQDVRFAGLDRVVRACGELALCALEQGRISALRC